ncbi:hypothetical protein ACQKP6_21705 [Pseudomonas fluorescens]|uniref:hypothetical protein n=1 Tax=Pseudomonas fluorescens TaxID=294 RepID=UPI003D036640
MLEIHRPTEPSVYYKAEAFHIAAKILHGNAALNYRGAPFIVNAAFSLELYLKSLMSKTILEAPEIHGEGYTSYNRTYSRSKHTGSGHDLNNLYQKLSEKIRSELQKNHQELSGNFSLTDFFNKNKAHFVNWRYSFEGDAEPYCAQDVLHVLDTFKSYASRYIVQC